MGSSTATAVVGVVGIVAAVATAAIGQWIALRRHRETLAHERALADRGELRSVIEDAASVVREAKWATDATVAALRAGRLRRLVAAAEEAVLLARASAQSREKISLRLGRDHEVAQAYEVVMQEFAALHERLLLATPAGWRVWLAFLHRRRLGRRLQALTDEAEEPFGEARSTFVAAAHRLVASRAD